MIKLTLTRHGETIENRQHILQGQLPGTLSPLGLQQAEDLSEKFRYTKFDAIVSSDLTRSYKTAEVVAFFHGLSPEPTPLLREMDWGIYTGKSLDKVNWENLPPSVESVERLFQRAIAFIDYLREKHPGQRVLAVGHGAFNRAVTTYLRGKQAIDMIQLPIMKNTECIEFDIT